MIDLKQLEVAMGKLDMDTVIKLLEDFMAQGGDDVNKVMDACQEGMNTVGKLFETKEYFVADLIFAGDLMNQVMEILKPALAAGGGGRLGKMVLCTVNDDLHDIGKNIVKAMMQANGIEVIDLGFNVAPETIINSAKQEKVDIIGLSGVLTLAIDSMKDTVDAIKVAGIRENVKIIIGGVPVTAEHCKNIGADAWTRNAAEGVTICRGWLTK